MREKENKLLPPELPQDNRKKEIRKHPFLPIGEVLKNIKTYCGNPDFHTFGNGDNYVVILPEAWEELKIMIGWGKRTPTNVFEQLYQGMGYYFNHSDGKKIVVVTHFLYIYAANRTPVSACVSNGVYDSTMNRMEYERKVYCRNEAKYNISPEGYRYNPFIEKFGNSEVNLFGHTHPDIGVFFSHDDKHSGYATPDMPAVIFVADPIRKQVKAVVGVEQEEAKVIICEYAVNNKEDPDKKLARTIKSEGHQDGELKGKSVEELLIELGKTCNELLNPVFGSKGNYSARTTVTGKEHIRVDIRLSPKVACKRRNMPSFASAKGHVDGGYSTYV